jgi:gliding motility-associated-like protein
LHIKQIGSNPTKNALNLLTAPLLDRKMKRILIAIFSILFVSFAFADDNPKEPKIGTLDGNQFLCVYSKNPEIEVKIEVPAGYSKEIDYFIIEWYVMGQSSADSMRVSASYNPPSKKIKFSLDKFFGSCEYEVKGDITVYTYIKGEIEPVNNGFKPTFRQPPTANFKSKDKACVSETIQLDGSISCPKPGIDKYTWTIDNKEVSSSSSFSYKFPKAGTYSVSLEVENPCGKDKKTKSIIVLDDPIAIAKVDSGATGNGPYYVCLNNKKEAFVKLDGRDSKNGTKYLWSFNNNSSSSTFESVKNRDTSMIKFTESGEYMVILDVSEPCDSDYDTLTFIVSKADVIKIAPVASSCNPINFTPSPNNPNAKYYIDGVQQNKFPFNLGYGIHKIKGVLNNECGETSDSIEIKIVQAVDTKILFPSKDTIVCSNSKPIPIIIKGENGTFNSPLVTYDQTSKQFLFLPTTVGDNTIIYSTGFNECKRDDKVVIKVLPGLNLTINHQNDVCLPFEYTPSPNISGAEYFINGQKIISFPYTISNSGIVKIEARLNNDCENLAVKDSFNAISAEALEIIIDGPSTVCVNSDPILIKSSIDGAVFSGSNLIEENNKTYFDPKSEGSFTIKLNLPLQGCDKSDDVTFEVIGVSTETKDISVCLGTKGVDLSGIPEGGVWTSSTCPSCITNNYFDLTKTNETKINISYSFTNDIGCSSTSNSFINIIEPKSVFELSSPPCGSIEFNTDQSVGDSFTWLINNVEVGQPPFTGLKNETYLFTLIAGISNCRDTSSQSIFVISPPANPADFELPIKSQCSTLLLNPIIKSPYYDFLDYKWTINFNGESIEFNSFKIDSGFELLNKTPYNKTAQVIFSAGNVCGMVETIDSVVVFAIPKAIIGIDSSRYGCSPYTIALSNISQGEIVECIWKVNGKEVYSCDPYIYQTFIANDTVTLYPIELEVSNECGRRKAYDTITVSPPWINVFFNTDEYEVCPNTPITFEDATTPAPIYWKWDFGNGKYSDEQNPTIEYSQPGTYYITLKASTGCGYDSITRPIIVKNAPNVDFILPVYACQNQSSDTIVNLSDYVNQKFVWDFGNGVKDSTTANPTPVFADFGNYIVSLTVTDKKSGCRTSLSKSYEIKAQPQINILLDSIICYGKELNIPNNTLYANNYTWYYDQIAVHAGKDPLIVFKETGEHYIQLVASYNDKCVDSISKVVFIRRCDVFIPNLFTPNNDGKDDFFTAFGGVNTSLIRSVKIFDRWGEMVFSKENFPLNVEYLGWDGSVSTRSKSYGLNSTVFVYMIEIEFTDGTREVFSGDVTLLR